ncbi:MAG: hypothetical protein RL095_382 [Verrucomicrobiota bacterium]|jgi:UDP-4-amino-4,6-dideoxy-N-acetyl-beta-L-altrosamine transaminase
MIPYGRQEITREDEEAVLRVLRSDFLTQGPAVPEFEQEQARLSGAPFAVAMNSATSALHAACAALGLGPGQSLWTSPNTFVASANCALYCGAQVDFVDIDPATLNLCPLKLEEKLLAAEKTGRLPAIVVPVHFGGLSCDMAAIQALSRRFGFKIIEDASHAVGGSYRGQAVGSCQCSDITIFSYHPVKIVTSAEGGMALTRDPELARKLQLFRSHGITRDPAQMDGDSQGPWYYQQIDLGYNYRMTDLQAALGRSQLERLDEYVSRRNEIARQYQEALQGLPLSWQAEQADTRSAYHLFTIQLHEPARRLELFKSLRAAGIGVNVHYIPVHTQPHYRRLGFQEGQFPAAEAYYAGAISLPMFPVITQPQFRKVVDTLRSLL